MSWTTRFRRTAFATAAALAAAPAFGHPGHGPHGGSHDLTHYLTEPEHLAPLGVAALVGAVVAAFVSRSRRRT